MSLASADSSDASGAKRTVLREVVPFEGMSVVDAASNAFHSRAMAECLKPVHTALNHPRTARMQQWQSVFNVLLSGKRQPQVVAFASIGIIVLLRTLLQDRIARLNGRIVDHVLQQDMQAFMGQVRMSVLQSLGSALLAPALRYATDMLALDWRKRLTDRILGFYLNGNTAHATAQLAGMSDAEQRLTRDVERVSTELAQLLPTLVKPVFDIVWFTWQMSALTGAQGVSALYGCALCSLVAMHPKPT